MNVVHKYSVQMLVYKILNSTASFTSHMIILLKMQMHRTFCQISASCFVLLTHYFNKTDNSFQCKTAKLSIIETFQF